MVFCESKISGIPHFSILKYNNFSRNFYLSIKTRKFSDEIFEIVLDELLEKITYKFDKEYLIVPIPSLSSDLPDRIAEYFTIKTSNKLWKILSVNPLKKSQKKTGKFQRQTNIVNEFRLDKKNILCYNPKNIELIIIDDMKTTGETLREVSRVLKKSDLKISFFITLGYRED